MRDHVAEGLPRGPPYRWSGDVGDRTWILRPLTAEHVAQIEVAKGAHSLEIDTFAGSEVWFEEAERD